VTLDVPKERSAFIFKGKAFQGKQKCGNIYVRAYWYRLVDGRKGFLTRWLFLMDVLTLEVEGIAFLRIIANHSPSDTVSHSRKRAL
jgi:hypothetical protein